jgi:aspartate-semialdehyde dehydrogenase
LRLKSLEETFRTDNLRKGAAPNAVQIAEVLVNRKLIAPKKKAA